MLSENIKEIVDKKFEGDYTKYIRDCKKNGHSDSIFGIIGLFLGAFIFTSGFLVTILSVMSVLSIIKGMINFKLVNKIREVYED